MAFGGMEWVLVLGVVVVLFFGGAKVIPQFAKSIGRARGEYERGKLEVEKELASERGRGEAPCHVCGGPLTEKDVKCLKCGSVRSRPQVSPGISQAIH